MRRVTSTLLAVVLAASACGGDAGGSSSQPAATTSAAPTTAAPATTEAPATTVAPVTTTTAAGSPATTAGGSVAELSGDITDAVFTSRDPSCASYAGSATSSVTDIGTGASYTGTVEMSATGATCTFTSNSIPNHDFNDAGAFVTAVAAVTETYTFDVSPTAATAPTALSLRYDNAVFLNGVKLDLLAAACYGVGNEPLGQERIGCFETGTPWRYDPMSPATAFGTDSHNAHTQPDGAYHYHGDPGAMYDDSGTVASPVIGFAADGFPIYGPWIDDGGTIRRAVSGYTLKEGDRTSQAGEGAFPGGTYDGTFVDDYEFTNAGDLDECNGMTRDGSYGYYVTDSYPWVLGCFTGVPDPSFSKR